MNEKKCVSKNTLLWIGVAVMSAFVAIGTVVVVLRHIFKKEEFCEDVECISYDFEPEELEFDDEFGAENIVDAAEAIEEADDEQPQD